MKIEKGFYYYHKPTDMFVQFEMASCSFSQNMGYRLDAYLKKEFDPLIIYKAKNILEESLDIAVWADEPFIDTFDNKGVNYDFSKKQLDPEEFALMECNISYDY